MAVARRHWAVALATGAWLAACAGAPQSEGGTLAAGADTAKADGVFAQDAGNFPDLSGTADAAADGAAEAAGQEVAAAGDTATGVDWVAADSAADKAPATIGAIRPADVTVPKAWATQQKWPLILILHGYGASGAVQDGYLGISARADQFGFVTVVPNGTLDASGKLYWNASDACCDFAKVGGDDVTYLTSLIDEAVAKLRVDPARVYLLGHSNGGFMALRMACEKADKVTAVASLAGAANADAGKCQPTQAVSVLQIHGTLDAVINYNGGMVAPFSYPSAAQTVAQWRKLDGCNDTAIDDPPIDFEALLLGNETTRQHWAGCAQATRTDLWTISGGTHIPAFTDGFREAVIAHLLAQVRTPKL